MSFGCQVKDYINVFRVENVVYQPGVTHISLLRTKYDLIKSQLLRFTELTERYLIKLVFNSVTLIKV